MTRKYVSLAIDHGTTNSCIARMTAQGPNVIPAEPGGLLLPSAVFYDRSGKLLVGSAARSAMLTSQAADGQGFTGYKLQIGGDAQYKFTAAGKTLSAPEIGAIIIQALLRANQRESGEDAQACVVTIPAKFKQNSVEGTRMAAEMAGLRYCPLIMEPVAAAMCYGFNTQQRRAQWMVFDLGGGTLDVSLVFSKQGKLIVPDGGHAGDDNLGGRYFDEQLAGYVLTQLEERYKLTKFRMDRGKFSNEWGRFLLAVEAAKIQLSARAESLVELETPLCVDDQGKEVEVKIPVTRKAYEDLIRPLAERTVQICKMLLKSNRLSAGDVERLILVGGPSKTPLILSMLRERLGIPLESSIDPMTAVAEGAAIYAGTVEVPGEDSVTVAMSAGSYRLKIDCERQSQLPTYQAVGLVDGPEYDGLRVEVERLDGLWKSPSVPVDPTGVFMVELLLSQGPKPMLSEFRADLLDRYGKRLASVQEPAIWYPSLAVENRLANSLRVALKANKTTTLIEPGAELPASGKSEFATTKSLRKGSSDDVLRIPVLESVTDLLGKEGETAGSCLHVGTLKIKGDDKRVTMDIPAGSEIEVSLSVDESRSIKAVAYIPLLDQDFETVFTGESFQYTLTGLEERVDRAKYQLSEVERFHGERPSPEVSGVLEIIRETKLVAGIDEDLRRAKAGDRDSQVRAYKRALELEGTIGQMQRSQRRSRIEVSIQTLREVTKDQERAMLTDIERDFARAGNDEEIEHCLASITDLEFAVRGRPWRELLLDLAALSGLRVTSRQHDAFVKASELHDRIEAKGGVAKVSDAEIAELQAMHRELAEVHRDLFEQRQKLFDKMGKGDRIEEGDLEARRAGAMSTTPGNGD
ncbi:MAG: Hsp70 family protein [Terracidiphilus sp.]|jgi:molecular chaperone DnaK